TFRRSAQGDGNAGGSQSGAAVIAPVISGDRADPPGPGSPRRPDCSALAILEATRPRLVRRITGSRPRAGRFFLSGATGLVVAESNRRSLGRKIPLAYRCACRYWPICLVCLESSILDTRCPPRH